MNPNYLFKDELQYEICIREINSEPDVQTLRKMFRSVVSEGAPVYLINLSSLGVEDLYGRVGSKFGGCACYGDAT